MANGDGGEFSHHIRETKSGAAWRQIMRREDGVKSVVFSHDGTALFLRSVKDAPRGKVLRMPTTGALGDAVVVVPEGEAVIEGITPTGEFLFIADMLGGPSRVRQLTLDGKDARILPLPEASGVGGVLEVGERIVFRQTSFVEPAAWMSYYWIWHDEDAMRTAQWKLHRFFNRYELYDIVEDETGSNNVADAKPEVVKSLAEKMETWAQKLRAAVRQPAP